MVGLDGGRFGMTLLGAMTTVTAAQNGGGLVDVLVESQKGLSTVGGSGLSSSSVTLTVTAMTLPAAGGMPLRLWVVGSNASSPGSGSGLGGSVVWQDSLPSANVAWYVRV